MIHKNNITESTISLRYIGHIECSVRVDNTTTKLYLSTTVCCQQMVIFLGFIGDLFGHILIVDDV